MTNELDAYMSAAVSPYWHPVGTAKIDTDRWSVVDPTLTVHGLQGLVWPTPRSCRPFPGQTLRPASSRWRACRRPDRLLIIVSSDTFGVLVLGARANELADVRRQHTMPG
jgi:GMC oxidoreductase